MATNTYNININAQQAQATIDRLTRGVDQLNNTFGGLRNALAGLGIAAYTQQVLSFAAAVQDVADANNVAIAEVLSLGDALRQSGGNADNVQRMFTAMGAAMESANQGNEKSIQSFARLGITMEQLGRLSQTEIQDRVFKALANMQNASERAALAQDVLGKAAIGINWPEYVQRLDKARESNEKYVSSIQSADQINEAFEESINNLKKAFLLTFAPATADANKLTISVETLTTTFKILAAAMAAAFGIAMLSQITKIIAALRTMNDVVSKNKLITIIGAIVGISSAAATWLGLSEQIDQKMEDVKTTTDQTAESVKGAGNNQDGWNKKIADAIASYKKITEELQRQSDAAFQRLQLDTQNLNRSEQQRKLAEDIVKIQQEGRERLAKLDEEFNKKSLTEQQATRDEYQRQRLAIEEITKARIAERQEGGEIFTILKDGYKQSAEAAEIFAKAQETILNQQIQLQLPIISNLEKRIELEQRLTALNQLRAAALQDINQVAEKDRATAIQAINEALKGIDLQKASYEDINAAIKDAVQGLVVKGQISEETARIIISNSEQERNAIISANRDIERSTKQTQNTARTFSYGWKKAFAEYVRNATDAAKQAERIFGKLTQGLEDLIVDFAKTGKFEWKGFVQSMLEELLRSQIQQTFANIMGAMGNAVDTGAGGILGTLGSLFGLGGGNSGQPRGQSPNTPLYVADVTGGGLFGGGNQGGGLFGGQGGGLFGGQGPLISGGGFGGGQNQGGGLFGTIGNVFGGVVDTVGSVVSGIGSAVGSVVDTIGSVFGGGGGGGGGSFLGNVVDTIGDFFGGFFANGGTLPGGKFGIVGERGPEIVTGPASISPMAGSQNVTYNINAVDAASFKAMIARDPAFIHSVAMMGAQTIPGRR